jgi:hypothetical protein
VSVPFIPLVAVVTLAFLFLAPVVRAEDWTTTDGKTYKDVKVISHNSKAVTISCTDGNATFPIANLNKDVQQRIADDNVTAADWTTTDGKTYKNVKVIKQDETSVTILDDDGGAVVPLVNLPNDLQKKFNYDPAKIQAEQKQKTDEQKAVALAQAAKAHANALAYIQANTKTIKEVESDLSSFVGKPFIINGTISVSTYYNYQYTDKTDYFYSFEIDQGSYSAYVYILKDAPLADKLRKRLLATDGGLSGSFTVEIDPQLYESGQTQLLANLLDCNPPNTPPDNTSPTTNATP